MIYEWQEIPDTHRADKCQAAPMTKQELINWLGDREYDKKALDILATIYGERHIHRLWKDILEDNYCLNYPCGWISPEGVLFSCTWACHSIIAGKIAYFAKDPEVYLEEMGWIKLSVEYNGAKNVRAHFTKPPTQWQKHLLVKRGLSYVAKHVIREMRKDENQDCFSMVFGREEWKP